jgi:beta-glucosidase/6-phospho-beta-glucosidase/beta-galactosidase
MFDIFSLPNIEFPKNFLFGAGYAGHQVEGDNIHSQWWAHEQTGRVEHLSGKACNSYEMWETDVNLCVEAGLKAFRTSVEWSRIEPSEGQFNAEALDHYVRFFATLKEKGIKVFATLVHFAVPLWFDKLGTFTNLDNMKYFEGYREMTVEEILSDPEIEAVVVETEEIYLTKYAIMVAKAGKQLHMEKPGGTSIEDFKELIGLLKEKQLVFSLGYMYRFNPSIVEAVERAQKGELG